MFGNKPKFHPSSDYQNLLKLTIALGMKIKISGSSIRMRLSKNEINKLITQGYLEEQTSFGMNPFSYALQCVPDGDRLSAYFDKNRMTMLVPETHIKDWDKSEITAFNISMSLSNTENLILMLEKDRSYFEQVANS